MPTLPSYDFGNSRFPRLPGSHRFDQESFFSTSNWNPYGASNVEIRAAQDPTFRPRFAKDELKTIPEYLRRLCARCWDAKPDRRPTFEEIVKALTGVSDTTQQPREVDEDEDKVEIFPLPSQQEDRSSPVVIAEPPPKTDAKPSDVERIRRFVDLFEQRVIELEFAGEVFRLGVVFHRKMIPQCTQKRACIFSIVLLVVTVVVGFFFVSRILTEEVPVCPETSPSDELELECPVCSICQECPTCRECETCQVCEEPTKCPVVECPEPSSNPDLPGTCREAYELSKEGTMVPQEKFNVIWEEISRLNQNGIEGAIVECGVYRGGAIALMMYAQMHFGETDRDFWLYDTFQGMVAPSDGDEAHAHQRYDKMTSGGKKKRSWAYGSLSTVLHLVYSTGYDMSNVFFVAGMVEDTLQYEVPQKIALLRLDTDFYESTKMEFEVLYPLLVPGGMVYIDDYCAYSGSKKATREYMKIARVPFSKLKEKPCAYFHKPTEEEAPIWEQEFKKQEGH